MSPFTQMLIINVLVFAVVLESDLGRRKIGPFRLLRPIVSAAVVIPLFMKPPAGAGDALLAEVLATVAGVALGLLACATVRVEYDAGTGRRYSRAGVWYAAVWAVVMGGRVVFSYGAEHWFSRQLGTFLIDHRIGADAFVDALIFMAFAMALTRTAVLASRRQAATVTAPGDRRPAARP